MNEITVRTLDEKRFNALAASTRSPAAAYVSQELAWFSNEGETVLGVLLLDTIDGDYVSIVLGPDETGRFRAFDVESFPDQESALSWLHNTIKWHTLNSPPLFPQGDETEALDLFRPIVPSEKQHVYFRRLISEAAFLPAREMISRMMPYYVDVDGNFVEQFQSTGFDSRVWELCLYAYLTEEELFLERKYNAPDFMVTKYGETVAIEAVIVGRKSDNPPRYLRTAPVRKTPREVMVESEDAMPIRFGSPLYTKLQKKYWELPHVKGNPIVFAIADFHDDQSMLWSSTALINYLYGYRHDFHYDNEGQLVIEPKKIESHKASEKEIPSGFFFQPDTEHVSAVLFSASGTISKFNRMGRQAGFKDPSVVMIREGTCHDHNPNAAVPKMFRYIVDEKCRETWGEGFSMYHNPNALHPVSEDLFPSIGHHRLRDGLIVSTLPDFYEL
ncbi:MAG: hypothetical protein A4E65_00105 [Syntrophorhabdus sp. PtaU1.Bin153]|nr:MAG: hypothetical protein A4E65_00105 [Syntrophorhabdus sp. PtaU1.Bin153]